MQIPSRKSIALYFFLSVVMQFVIIVCVFGDTKIPTTTLNRNFFLISFASTVCLEVWFMFVAGSLHIRRKMSLENLSHACELSDLHARLAVLEMVMCSDEENPMATREQKNVLHAWRSILTGARASLEWHVERLFGKNSDRPEKYHDSLKGVIAAVRKAAENRLTERENSTEHFQELVEPVEADKWEVTICFGPPGSRWWRKIVICLEDISDTKGNLLVHGSSPVIPVFPFVTPAPAPVAAPVASAKEMPVVSSPDAPKEAAEATPSVS